MLGALVGQPAVHERVGDQPLQVGGRLPLHAGRDFLGEEFEQQVGHGHRAGREFGRPS